MKKCGFDDGFLFQENDLMPRIHTVMELEFDCKILLMLSDK